MMYMQTLSRKEGEALPKFFIHFILESLFSAVAVSKSIALFINCCGASEHWRIQDFAADFDGRFMFKCELDVSQGKWWYVVLMDCENELQTRSDLCCAFCVPFFVFFIICISGDVCNFSIGRRCEWSNHRMSKKVRLPIKKIAWSKKDWWSSTLC